MLFKNTIIALVLSCAALYSAAQDKRGHQIASNHGFFLDFTKLVATRPTVKIVYNSFDIGVGQSILCDSATGRVRFKSNGAKIYDSTMAIIQNGDSLVDSAWYAYDAKYGVSLNQGSLLVPVGNLIYHFNVSLSDSSYLFSNDYLNRFYYSIIDPAANNYKGKVISKKNLIFKDTVGYAGMQVLRHANGIDWWLYKTGSYQLASDSLKLHRWLLSANGLSKHVVIPMPHYSVFPDYNMGEDPAGAGIQFNEQGTQMLIGRNDNIIMADVNRCTGAVTNITNNTPAKIWTYSEPDSSTTFTIILDTDSLFAIGLRGLCYSPNGKYIYVMYSNSILQWDWADTNPATAWVTLRAGGDTVWQWRNQYGFSKLGPDNRIYVGTVFGSGDAWQVIDNPDAKGLACSLRLRQIIVDKLAYPVSGMACPSNSPNYKLGKDESSCWPLAIAPSVTKPSDFGLYPNPTNTSVTIALNNPTNQMLSITNASGQIVHRQVLKKERTIIDVSKWASGVYFVRVGSSVKQLAVSN